MRDMAAFPHETDVDPESRVQESKSGVSFESSHFLIRVGRGIRYFETVSGAARISPD
jgi:hypothetical protein